MDQATCPHCGATSSQWTQQPGQAGYQHDDEQYCCRDCAEGVGCGCQSKADAAREEIPHEGVAGKEELRGQDAGQYTATPPDTRGPQETHAPNDERAKRPAPDQSKGVC